MLFDRLGNRLVEHCIVVDCVSGGMFVLTGIYITKHLARYADSATRVDVLMLDHPLDTTFLRDSFYFASTFNVVRAKRWELIREVDYVPF